VNCYFIIAYRVCVCMYVCPSAYISDSDSTHSACLFDKPCIARAAGDAVTDSSKLQTRRKKRGGVIPPVLKVGGPIPPISPGSDAYDSQCGWSPSSSQACMLWIVNFALKMFTFVMSTTPSSMRRNVDAVIMTARKLAATTASTA